MRWAGIDLGTTHLKAVLYDDRARRIVSSATAPTPMRTADSLSAHEAEAFYGESQTGLHERFRPDPWFSLFKLLWLRAHRPAELERCVRVLDLSAFMLVRLGAAAVMDWSHASRTGVFDPESASWDAQTIAAAGLPAAWFPPLVPSGTIAGQVSNATAARLRIGRG